MVSFENLNLHLAIEQLKNKGLIKYGEDLTKLLKDYKSKNSQWYINRMVSVVNERKIDSDKDIAQLTKLK